MTGAARTRGAAGTAPAHRLLPAAGYARILGPLDDEFRVDIAAVGGPDPGPADLARSGPLLEEISAFRGHTYHADGLRPGFRVGDGFADPQPGDRNAYHVMLRHRDSGQLAAVVRLVPRDWAPPGHGAVEQVFGAPAADLLSRRGLNDADVLEGGRLAVAPDHQNYSVGPMICLVALAFAQSVGRSFLWGLSGTSDRQDLLFARLGARIHPEFREPDAKYHDTMTLYSFDIRDVPPVLRPSYARLRRLLATGSFPTPAAGPSGIPSPRTPGKW